MKPEPLKGKIQTYCCPLEGTPHWKYFQDINVKSAVEWLKDKIYANFEGVKELRGIDDKLSQWIDEAFEDVIKE